MSLLIARLLIIISIIYILQAMIIPILKPMSKRHRRKARSYLVEKKKLEKKQRQKLRFKHFAIKYCQRLVSDADRFRFNKLVSRLEMESSPEEIRLKQIVYAGMALFLAVIAYTANPALGYICAILIFLVWIIPVNELEERIEKKDKMIALDFPGLYSMIYYQYAKSVNLHLSDVIKDYLPNANVDMAEELGVMLDNIEFGESFALKEFKKRVPLHYIIRFCDIMETRLKGYDNVSQMTFLKNELDEYRIINLEAELERRRQSNERIQLILIVVLVVYIVIYYTFMILHSINLFQ